MEGLELVTKIWEEMLLAPPTYSGQEAEGIWYSLRWREGSIAREWLHWTSSAQGDWVYDLANTFVKQHAKVQGNNELGQIYSKQPLFTARTNIDYKTNDKGLKYLTISCAVYSNGALCLQKKNNSDTIDTYLWVDKLTAEVFKYPDSMPL